MTYSVSLAGLNAEDLQLAGGKAANLGRLASANFPVPPGFCITTAAYQEVVRVHGLQTEIDRIIAAAQPDDPTALEAASAAIRAGFEKASIPQHIADDICRSYEQLCNGSAPLAVAVRSSATAEDLPEMSFAGQQDTYLNILGEADLLSAVARCWGSLWTARAIGYRARNRLAHDDVSLAVVVQVMVQSEASGVLFTANPLTGKRTETVIDATFGLGEALVSGMVEPDHYVVDTTARQITEKTLGAKRLAIRGQDGGGTVSIEDEQASTAQALPDEHILALADIGSQIASRFGSPQDIEWAYAGEFLYIVQSRPITSLFPQPEGLDANGELKTLFSFGSVQGMLDPITPLGRDVFKMMAAQVARDLGQDVTFENQNIIFESGERLFINFTGAFRHSIFRKVITAFMGAIDPLVQQVFQSLYEDPRLAVRKTPMRFRTRLLTIRFITSIFSNVFFNILWPSQGRKRLNQRIEKTVYQTYTAFAGTKSMAERMDVFQIALRVVPNELRSVLLPAVISGQAMFQPLIRLSNQLPDNHHLGMELARGLPHNVTTEMDLALWDVSRIIQADPDSSACFTGTEPDQLAAAYHDNALPQAAQNALGNFMGRYGMRGLAEIDLGRPRWRDDPAQIMQVLGSYLKIEDEALSPRAIFNSGETKAALARQQLIAALRQTKHGWLKARFAAFASIRVRELVGLRETPKFTAIRIMGFIRAFLLKDGNQLAAQGILSQPEDIFFLHFGELKRLAAGEQAAWRELADSRRQVYQREKRRKQIPRMLLSDGTAYYESFSVHAAVEDECHITGSPVSPGIVEGTAHVLLDPRGAQLSPGEILVCPATDPGWTPLFLAAGGLVMEMGGMMTHGSVVAREYGIPAVVGVPHATTRIKTGQRLRVDGTRGEVEILD
jgi:rifampicin phosphotransferase